MIRGLSAVPVRRMTIQSEWRGMRWPSRCALAGVGGCWRALAGVGGCWRATGLLIEPKRMGPSVPPMGPGCPRMVSLYMYYCRVVYSRASSSSSSSSSSRLVHPHRSMPRACSRCSMRASRCSRSAREVASWAGLAVMPSSRTTSSVPFLSFPTAPRSAASTCFR